MRGGGVDDPGKFVSCAVVVWSTHTQRLDGNFGSTRNGVKGLGSDLELLCNEAALSRGREPGCCWWRWWCSLLCCCVVECRQLMCVSHEVLFYTTPLRACEHLLAAAIPITRYEESATGACYVDAVWYGESVYN